jgi:hypothetical protein
MNTVGYINVDERVDVGVYDEVLLMSLPVRYTVNEYSWLQ